MTSLLYYQRNIDLLPPSWPDLPSCPSCGSVWVAVVQNSFPEPDPRAVLVVCFSGHRQWFGLRRQQWCWLNRPEVA